MAILSSKDTSKSLAVSLTTRVAAGVSATLIAASALGAELTVQIGAFGVSPKANFTEQAKSHGEVLVTQSDDGMTRVSIGRYQTLTEARSALSHLQTAGYPDAYIANVTSGDQSSTAPAQAIAAQTAVTPITQQNSAPQAARATRTITNPTTASSQRLPSGGQLVTPKHPDTSGVAKGAQENNITQAGRFRLRTHDTQSGQTTDVNLESDGTAKEIVPGKTFKEIPVALRNNLVYLDGVPHIKEGDQFIPLDDAVDSTP